MRYQVCNLLKYKDLQNDSRSYRRFAFVSNVRPSITRILHYIFVIDRGVMLVRLLEVVHYPPEGVAKAGFRWETLAYPKPDWETIVTWIDQLDRNIYPFLDLHIGQHTPWDEPELALNVTGGRGEFALCIFRNGHHLYFQDLGRSNKVVQIWESDQGSLAQQNELCNDRELVLKIARHFADTGEAFPGVEWTGD